MSHSLHEVNIICMNCFQNEIKNYYRTIKKIIDFILILFFYYLIFLINILSFNLIFLIFFKSWL